MRSLYMYGFLIFLVSLISGCGNPLDDRLTQLTGAKSNVERVYVCGEIYQEDAVKARMLRDSVKSHSDRTTAIAMIEEADLNSGRFIVMLEDFSPEEFQFASRSFSKRFTRSEFTSLFDEYGSVLKAHCEDML